MQLGDRISALRTKAGMNQSALAEALGVSRQTVSKWETNAAVPDLERLLKLADLFGVSLDALVRGEEEAQPQSPESAPQPPAPRERTRAQTAGYVLLGAAAVAALVFAVLFGIAGVLFSLPLLVPGLICCIARKHPALKALWAEFLLLTGYTEYATGIRAGNILQTFQWTFEMNYARLAIAWVLFLATAALVLGTAIALRKGGWTGGRGQKAWLITSAVLLALTFVPIRFTQAQILAHAALVQTVFTLLRILRLGALTVLATCLARLLWAKWAAKRT